MSVDSDLDNVVMIHNGDLLFTREHRKRKLVVLVLFGLGVLFFIFVFIFVLLGFWSKKDFTLGNTNFGIVAHVEMPRQWLGIEGFGGRNKA